MYRAKKTLAIAGTTLILLTSFAFAPPRTAAVVLEEDTPAARVARASVTAHVRITRSHRRIHSLATVWRRYPWSRWVRAEIVREERRTISVTRAIQALNRQVLAMAELDETTVRTVLAVNARMFHIDRDVARVGARVPTPLHRRLARSVRTAASQLRTLDAKVRGKWRAANATPTPTPTATPTPMASPSETPTMEPSADPTPTPTSTPTATSSPVSSPTTTYTNYVVPAGTHDVVYENCRFTGGSADITSGGVLSITKPCSNIVFRNCVIDSGPGQGIKIVDYGATVHDIRFENCTIKAQPCMGFECISRPTAGRSGGYQRIDLINCTFEPQGSEAVSYDCDGDPRQCGTCLIDGVLIKGAGTNPNYWGQGLEINGPTNMTVRNTTIYRTRSCALNLNGKGVADCGWTFSDCLFDMTTSFQRMPHDASAGILVPFGMNGALFSRCTFNAGAVAWGNAWLADGCDNNDFRSCTLLGVGSYRRVYDDAGNANNLWPEGTLFW